MDASVVIQYNIHTKITTTSEPSKQNTNFATHKPHSQLEKPARRIREKLDDKIAESWGRCGLFLYDKAYPRVFNKESGDRNPLDWKPKLLESLSKLALLTPGKGHEMLHKVQERHQARQADGGDGIAVQDVEAVLADERSRMLCIQG